MGTERVVEERRRDDLLVVRRVEHVHRQGHEHRAHGRRGRLLHGPAQHPQQRPGVDDAGRPLRRRARPWRRGRPTSGRPWRRSGRRTRRRSRPAGRGPAWPGTSCRSRCRGRRRCAAGRSWACGWRGRSRRRCRRPRSPAGPGCTRGRGTRSSASRKPCSTVPGLPNMYVTPSAMNCSIMANRPVLAVTSSLGQERSGCTCSYEPLSQSLATRAATARSVLARRFDSKPSFGGL